MQQNFQPLAAIFKRTVQTQLKKVDSYNPVQRINVYKSAFRALNRINENDKNLTEKEINGRISLMWHVVNSFEASFVNNQKKLTASEPVSIGENVVDLNRPEPVLNGLLLSDDLQKVDKKQRFARNISVKLIIVFACLSVITLVVLNKTIFKNNQGDGVKFQLPYTLIADDSLMKYVKLRGLGKVEELETTQAITYSVGERDERLEALDIIIRDKDLLDYLHSQIEPIVITFDLQKLTKAEMELDLVVRGLGKSVRQVFVIKDQKQNKIFIVADPNSVSKRAEYITIRFIVKSKAGESEKNVKFSLKNLVLDFL